MSDEEKGSLFLLRGHYDLEEATFVTYNGFPSHFEWTARPNSQQKMIALADAHKLVGKKLKMWGLWKNDRTGLFYTSTCYVEKS
jgi:hypothetical protein